MVKNALGSLRNSTSTLSLRPSTAESQSEVTRQHIANLEARIALLQARNVFDREAIDSAGDDAGRAAERRTNARLAAPVSPTVIYDGRDEPYPWAAQRAMRMTPPRATQPEKSLFEKYNETLQEQYQKPKGSLITKGLVREGNALKSPEAYTQPFCDFLTENPTVWHAVDYFEKKLEKAGFKKVGSSIAISDPANNLQLSERKTWNDELEKGGKYYVSRNGSSLIAFTVGGGYKSGNGVAMIAGHVDALTARLKPMSNKRTAAGYVQLGVAPYAGALNATWWDRDLGIGGRVLVKDSTGKITTKLVKLGWPSKFGISVFGCLLTF